jgi:pectate lyase
VIRLFRRRRLVVGGALVLCVLAASAYGAHRLTATKQHRAVALYTFAKNPAWFQSELDRVAVTGGKITLPAGRVVPLTLLALTPSAPIRLVGRPSTVLGGISIKRSRNISVSDVRISPGSQPAIADVRASQDIIFRNVRFLGAQEDRGVAIQLDADDRNITISHSEFSFCQHGLACILAQGRGLTVDHVRFHTVRDADVIRGAADNVTISDSDLHDALPGTHGDNHNDLIQILGGGPWTIQRNHFGVRANGAAQVYVDSRSGPQGYAHDVHVYSNVFTGSNKDMYFAIQVRTPAQSATPVPAGIEIVNNTIVSANVAAITLADEYAKVPAARRPLVENNILGLQKRNLCDVARVRTNVVEKGLTCPGDHSGAAHLDGADKPTAASAKLLAGGTSAGAPATDRAGKRRANPPAIGAYEVTR